MAKEIENDNSETVEEEEIVTEETDVPEEAEETVEELREKNKQLFARAKKAEGFEEVDGKWVKKPKPIVETKPATKVKDKELSTTDVYALVKAEVPEEDVDEVKRVATALGMSVAEAIKDPVTKGILERKAALRKTAEATNVTTARPGSKKVTDEQLLDDASKGILPEKGSKEAQQLFWARRGGQKR